MILLDQIYLKNRVESGADNHDCQTKFSYCDYTLNIRGGWRDVCHLFIMGTANSQYWGPWRLR